jgi:hypothetical protein
LTLDDTMTIFSAGQAERRPRLGRTRVELARVTHVAGQRDIRYGAAVYGSFLVASVVGATFEAGADARTLTGSGFVSMLVFWLAHVWSEVVGEHVSAGTRFHARVIPVIARREWPLVEAAAVPTALLALAWAGVWSRQAGAALALGSAILQITGGGVVGGFRSGASPLNAVILGVGQGILGVLLLVLESLIH